MDHKVKVWDLTTLKEIQTLNGHTNWTQAVAFSQDGKILATGGADSQLILWSTETWGVLDTLKGHPGQIVAVAFSDDSNTIASLSAPEGTIRVWQNFKARSVYTIQAQKNVADVVAISPKGGIAATHGREGRINIWQLATGSRLFSFQGKGNETYRKSYPYPAVRTLDFSSDGQLLAIVTNDGSIEVWDVSEPENPSITWTLDVMNGATCIAFSPDEAKQILVAGTMNGTVLEWNVDSSQQNEPIAKVIETSDENLDSQKNDRGKRVDMIEFSRDGTIIAAGRNNGQLTVWNLEKDSRYDRQIGGKFRAIAFSDTGELAVKTETSLIQLREAKDGTLKAEITDSFAAFALVYMPNSNNLLAGGYDGSVRRYNTSLIEDKKITHPQHYFRGHKATVVSLDVSKDGNTFVSSDDLGVLRVWRGKSISN